MSKNLGFVCITRSLLEKPEWIDARPAHQTVFMTIIMRCAFKDTDHSIQGNAVKINPGQLCATIRQIQEWSGKWISKNDVVGAIKYFKKTNFLRQEVRHGKTLITIIESDVYETLIRCGQTTTQMQVRHKEEREEIKEEQQEHTRKSAEPLCEKGVCLSSINEKFEIPSSNQNEIRVTKAEKTHNVDYQKPVISKDPKLSYGEEGTIKLTQKQYDDLLLKMDEIERDYWIEQLTLEIGKKGEEVFNKKYRSHYHTILSWKKIRAERSISTKISSEKNPVDANREYAQRAEKCLSSKFYRMDVTYQGVEFIPLGGQTLPDFIPYSSNAFREQVENTLRKKQFEKRTLIMNTGILNSQSKAYSMR